MALTDPSQRLEAIPPYMFAELERKVADKKAAGIDVISLGIGDPDTPTYPHIVEAMQEAVADPGTHQYPSNRGRAEFREAFARFYDRRFGVEIDPETEVIPAIGAKECIYNLCFAFLDPEDVALASDPGYPVYTGGPVLAGAEAVVLPLEPELGLRARPRRDRPARALERAAHVPELPEQPDRRGRARRPLRAGRRARAQARVPGRPRQRLLGDDLRRLRRAELPRDAGRQGGGRRGLLALQGLQHDRLALRRDPRQRRRDPDRTGASRRTSTPACSRRCSWPAPRRSTRPRDSIDGDERGLRAPARPGRLGARATSASTSSRRRARSTCGRRCRRATRRPRSRSSCWRRPPSSSRPGSMYGPSGEGFFRISLTTPDERITEAVERMREHLAA